MTNYFILVQEVLKTLQEVLEELCFTSDEKMWAPYVYKSALLEKGMYLVLRKIVVTYNIAVFIFLKYLLPDFGWSIYDAEAEYNRLGLGGDSRYKLYSNEGYSLCSTYPR